MTLEHMVNDDFWAEVTKERADTDLSTDTAQSQFIEHKNMVYPILPSTIPQTSLSAPIIFADIWGEEVEEVTVTAIPNTIDQHLNIEPLNEWYKYERDFEPTLIYESRNETSTEALSVKTEKTSGFLQEFENSVILPAFDEEAEPDFLLDDFELLDIDVELAKLAEDEALLLQDQKHLPGVIIGHGNVSGWMGHNSLFYIDWNYGEEAEQEALLRLGYTDIELRPATRAFIIQAARACHLPRRQELEITRELAHLRLLLAQLPQCKDAEDATYIEEREILIAEERAVLIAKIVDLEQTLVYKMQWVAVKKAVHFLGQGIELDDLIQYGMLGVIAGVKHFDINKNARLIVAINWWVFQSLNRAVAENVHLIRLPIYLVELLQSIKKQHTALQMSLGRLPRIEELAATMQLSEVRVKELLGFNHKIISLDNYKHAELVNEGYSFMPIEEGVAKNEDTFNDETDIFDSKQIVDDLLKFLTLRERQVISLRFGLDNDEEKTLEEVGKILGVTRERIRQIADKALKKIRGNYHLIKRMAIDAQATQQKAKKITPQTSSTSVPEKTVQINKNRSANAVTVAEDERVQKSITKVNGHTFEKITFRRGFLLRKIHDNKNSVPEAATQKPTIDRGEQKLQAKIQRVRKNLGS